MGNQPGSLRTAYLSRAPLAAPVPEQPAKASSQVCWRCWESELDAELHCPGCGAQFTAAELQRWEVRQAERALSKEIEQCRLEDERRGEPGSSSSGGSKSREKSFGTPGALCIPEHELAAKTTQEFVRSCVLRVPGIDADSLELRRVVNFILTIFLADATFGLSLHAQMKTALPTGRSSSVVRVSEAERAQLHEAAKCCGCPLSELMRWTTWELRSQAPVDRPKGNPRRSSACRSVEVSVGYLGP